MTLAAGTRLGPYEIVAPAGAGGMGEVYRARDTRLDRTVAVKVLPEHLSSSPELRQRFEREAKTISLLSHPHICALFDVGSQDGIEYLVMEYLEGETLSERLVRGPLPAEQTLRYAIEMADALDRAHRQGVVHRDLKPGNVMLTKPGVKLLDFGLAKLAAPPGSTGVAGLSMLPTTPGGSNLTAKGTILGTFQYMAPEQLEGKEADARTDIFALGAVLYEMATGNKAFAGSSQASLISAIMASDPPSISSSQPATPPALDRLVRTCLAKDPEERWQSAGDIAKELKWIGEGAERAAGASGLRPRRPTREWLAWSIAAAASLALAFFLARPGRSSSSDLPTRSTVAPPEKTDFETSGDNCGSLTLSPDGRLMTFAAKGPAGKVMLWLRPLENLTARPIPGTEGASFPFWSPDSRSLAFFASGKLERVDLAGSPPLVLCEAASGRSGSWNRDGVILFSPGSNTGIFQVPATGGTATPVTQLDSASGETTHRWASFLPDGKHFVYLVGSHSEGSKSQGNAVYLSSLESKERKRLLQGHANVAFASGHLFLVRDHALMAQAFDANRGTLSGDPVPIAYGVQDEASYFRGDFAVSDSGAVVYATGGGGGTGSRLQWFDMITGKPSGEPFGETAEYRQLSVSPDGLRVAASIADPSTGLPEIWLLDMRGARTRLTFGAPAFSPVFAPDGARVAYAKGSGIYVKPASGGGEELVYASKAQLSPTDWSQDGRFLLFESFDSGGRTKSDIWILPFFGDRKARPLLATEANEQDATFSPDGRWVSYMSDESGRPEIYVASLADPSRKWQVSLQGAVGAAWISQKEIGFGSLDFNAMRVDVTETHGGLEFSAPRVLFKVPPLDANPATAPDGKRYLLAVHIGNAEPSQVVLVTNWLAALARR